ncbi:unnamed protein product [Withania somnifera]
MALSVISLSQTTSLKTNLRNRLPKDVQRASAFLMPITDLNFARVHTINLIRFRHPRFLSGRNISALKSPMAEEVNNKSTVESTENKSEKNTEKSMAITPPPPPEKPLPDDCCGSGCVRCVWDMYYEELEEYNKLYKSDPDVKPS